MKIEGILVSILAVSLCSADTTLKREGEKLYISMGCYGCHGVVGEGLNDFPALAGRSKSYLAKRLRELKKGGGYTSRKEMMIPYAKALDEKKIDAITTFLAEVDGENEENMEVPEDILGGSNM